MAPLIFDMMDELVVPYWLKLITAWCAAGGTGLSIPFLVGAQTLGEDSFTLDVEDIVEFLDELFTYDPGDNFIRIMWYNEVKTFVIGICTENDFEDGLLIGKVHVSVDVIQEFGDSKADIIYGITTEYLPQITNGLFSVNSGKWYKFTEQEQKFILRELHKKA